METQAANLDMVYLLPLAVNELYGPARTGSSHVVSAVLIYNIAVFGNWPFSTWGTWDRAKRNERMQIWTDLGLGL